MRWVLIGTTGGQRDYFDSLLDALQGVKRLEARYPGISDELVLDRYGPTGSLESSEPVADLLAVIAEGGTSGARSLGPRIAEAFTFPALAPLPPPDAWFGMAASMQAVFSRLHEGATGTLVPEAGETEAGSRRSARVAEFAASGP